MGFTRCKLCCGGDPFQRDLAPKDRVFVRYSSISSDDPVLFFTNGMVYRVSGLILHYIADHSWRPPERFITSVMNYTLVDGKQLQGSRLYEVLNTMQNIGYLKEGDIEKSRRGVPRKFLTRLERFVKKALDYRPVTMCALPILVA